MVLLKACPHLFQCWGARATTKNRKLDRDNRRWRNMAALLWRNWRQNRPLRGKSPASESSTQPLEQSCSRTGSSDSKSQSGTWWRASSTCRVSSSAIMISKMSLNSSGTEGWKQNFLRRWEVGCSSQSIQSWRPSRSASGTRWTSSCARGKTSKASSSCSLIGAAAHYQPNPAETRMAKEWSP